MLNKNYHAVKNCRLCKSQDIETVLDFGETALANSFLKEEDLGKPEVRVQLEVFLCGKCGCVQLKHTVNPEILFKHYLYESSTSPSFRKHFEDYAKDVKEKLNLSSKDFILEIGANDLVLLKPFKGMGFKNLYNVDPAENLAKKHQEKNITTICDFFSDKLVNEKLSHLKGKFSLICANNVFAHISDLDSVVEGIRQLLNEDGVFVFEVTYLKSNIENLYFDMQYHEHIFTHSVAPLQAYFRQFNMEMFDVQIVNTHGGSIRGFVKKQNGKWKVEKSVEEFINQERSAGLFSIRTYYEFYHKILLLKERLLQSLIQFKNEGKRIWAYGAPAKLTTFSKVMGINHVLVEKIVEDAKLKQGLFAPGTHIQIVSPEEFLKSQPDVCVILAWNFAEQIKEKYKNYRGLWINPFEK